MAISSLSLVVLSSMSLKASLWTTPLSSKTCFFSYNWIVPTLHILNDQLSISLIALWTSSTSCVSIYLEPNPGKRLPWSILLQSSPSKLPTLPHMQYIQSIQVQKWWSLFWHHLCLYLPWAQVSDVHTCQTHLQFPSKLLPMHIWWLGQSPHTWPTLIQQYTCHHCRQPYPHLWPTLAAP